MTQTRAQGIMVAMLAVPPVDTGAPLTSREQPPPLTGSQCLYLYLTKPITQRKHYGQVRKEDCSWWRYFQSPEALHVNMDEPDGHLAHVFHYMLQMLYDIFKTYVHDLTVEIW